jgi:hypothetical protein
VTGSIEEFMKESALYSFALTMETEHIVAAAAVT